MGPTDIPVSVRRPGRRFLLLGLLLAVLGIAGYAVQVWLRHLTTPWYLPLTGTAAAALVVYSLRRGRSVWRYAALVLVLLAAVAEWGLVVGSRVPEYAGPVAAGQPFPSFTTLRADGSRFTERDLRGDRDNVLVFFRGRW